MTKKKILLIILLALIVASVVFFFTRTPQSSKEVKNTEREKFGLSKKTKTFIDPSGFKFSYPENLNMETKENKEEDVYSELTIMSEEINGGVEITAAETGDKTIEEWLLGNKLKIDSKKITKTKLGDLSASRFENGNKLYTLALDDGILFSVITDREDNKELWKLVHNEIEKSFVFSAPEAAPDSLDGSPSTEEGTSDEIIFEGEEVIE